MVMLGFKCGECENSMECLLVRRSRGFQVLGFGV